MSTNAALAAAATLIAIAFGASTFERWLDRRRPHDLAWSVSLLFFSIASAALWLGVAKGWDAATFRVFFLFGAIVNVPWLAIGSIYLLAGPRHGRRWAVLTAALSCFSAGVMAVSPTKRPVPLDGLPKGSALFGVLPRVLAAVASGAGAVVVIAAAAWSAVLLVRGRRQTDSSGEGRLAAMNRSRLAAGNVLIALGTIVLGLSGTLAGRIGEARAFALSLVVGVTVLFGGFLVATSAVDGTRSAESAEFAPQHFAADSMR